VSGECHMIGVSGLPHHFLGSFWLTFFVSGFVALK
jgi:hypothetical protein